MEWPFVDRKNALFIFGMEFFSEWRVFLRPKALGFSMKLLDIGGGFPGNDDVDIPSGDTG